ncbi:MAG TPA: succinylglutamate desuccinylase/aspartoacylase family protein, partial [Bacteroidia bacterium]|nr:succinylglutamate desuccinylase/aspartoacylase family protein [Bacteroidia bacterium]
MQKDIIINGNKIIPGQSAQVNLNLYRLPTRTIIEIPVFVFRSLKPGPTILFLAGMHGDEINGIEIIRRLLAHENVQHPLCGTVIVIPVINIVSFINGKRELPDGRDLNRCFPGSKTGSLGSRIAYDLMNEIVPQIDFGIDFHTGGSKISNHPQIRCVQQIKTNMDLAKIFSPPLIVNSKYRDNSLRKEASRKRKTMLVFEGGESSRFDYPSINEGVNGCLRVLHHYKMISEGVP